MEYFDNDCSKLILNNIIERDIFEVINKFVLIEFPILPENLEKIKSYYEMIRTLINTRLDTLTAKLVMPPEQSEV